MNLLNLKLEIKILRASMFKNLSIYKLYFDNINTSSL